MPFEPSQETIAIVTVGLALATLMLTTTASIRAEARAARAAWEAESRQLRDEAQAHREAWEAESRQLRDEARAHRDAVDAQARADREHFQREILRLTGETARLGSRDLPEQSDA